MRLKDTPINEGIISRGGTYLTVSWRLFFDRLEKLLNLSRPWELPSYTVATVPSAADYLGSIIFVSNETGGSTVAYSDGTNWRRTQDRAIIS